MHRTGRRAILQDVPRLSNDEVQHPESAWTFAQPTDPRATLGIDSDGLRQPIPRVR